MFKLKKTQETIDFCDRCGSVCDAACRSDQVREQALDRALRQGPRF
jgi:hypothetical protein